jgi:hypothetical protein
MRNYPAIRHFLANHHGHYCAECLATRLNLSAAEVRRSVGQRIFAEITTTYRMCHSCLTEKAVFALRHSA